MKEVGDLKAPVKLKSLDSVYRPLSLVSWALGGLVLRLFSVFSVSSARHSWKLPSPSAPVHSAGWAGGQHTLAVKTKNF